MKKKEYKRICEELWKLLDDIDTASDMFKPCSINGIKSYDNFYKYSLKKVSKRFEYLKSDGFGLFTPTQYEKKYPLNINGERTGLK